EEATREVIDPQGWFHTGDAGFIDPRGHLVIIDRAKDVGALADGTPFAPQFVENKLKFSPFIREAVAFGDQKPFVTAMIAIDMSTVGNWAERRSLAYTSYMDLLLSNDVVIGLMYALIALGVVLVYNATDAINCAQGEFVMISGFVAAAGIMVWGTPLWLAVALALGGMIILGFALERVMLR